MRTGRFGLIFLFALLSSACTKKSTSGESFLLPWGPTGSDFSLQKVKIRTIKSPYEATGPAADVYVGSEVSSQGFVGDKARPRVTKAGSVYVPKDIESSMALVVYAHMERLKIFDDSLNFNSRVSWPRSVGIQIEFVDEEGAVEDNNAVYIGSQDIVAFFPTSIDELPMTINGGILAHEHFHAHFQQWDLKTLHPDLSRTDRLFNEKLMIRGWNEGLADFYAYVYTKNPNVVALSLPGQQLRSLAAMPLPIRSTRSFFTSFLRLIPENPGSVLGCLSYPLGTQYAVLLKAIADAGTETSAIKNREDLLRHIMARLSEKPGVFGARNAKLSSTYMLDQIFNNFSGLNWDQQALITESKQNFANSKWREVYPCE